ncbi:MAG TPA: PSD1 and planctomycete cytochrome C domain-containing protein [Blastocatellia bacterium]|nr:PSD1 and planctomycete cytochrome C domain-containing protein [Blastocatellia bacterium]
MKYKRFIVSLAFLGLASWPVWSQNKEDYFEAKVRPILATECFSCHTDSQLGGLRLDSREAMLRGGKSGPAIVPGDPEKSLLVTAIRQTGTLKMPKGGKLAPDQIEAIAQWIRTGAVWPDTVKTRVAPKGEMIIDPARRGFWSFQPLHPSAAPTVKNTHWPKTDIDRFILSRLEEEGLAPVGPADRRTLLRRATLDLIGIPPTAAEIEAFENDKSPNAFAKVIDRLLACPQYGERWGRLWLDVARYGEDDYRSLDPMGRGFAPYPHAYLYRDWVVKAFNDDLPYDQFVRAQLAGDQLDEKTRVKTLPALGFLGQGPWFYDNGAVEVTRADERHDRIDVVSRGFLGLTVGCARCHDHKYDPIPTKDYYAMAGVFASTTYREYPQVPKSIVDRYTDLEKKLKNKEKLLGEFLQNEARLLSEGLTLQASKYMQAVWRVGGEPKEDLNDVIEKNKLDYELMQRWIKFLARPPRYYPYLKDWQAMMQKGGTAPEAKKLSDDFQALLLDVLFERKDLKEQNDIIIAKSLTGTKPKEPLFKPNEFVTNDDFCPSCSVETKAMPLERTNLWMDVYVRDLDDPMLPGINQKFKPGLLAFRGWGLERQMSAEGRAYLSSLREEIESFRKKMPAQYPYVHGVADQEKPVDLPVSLRGNPNNLGEVIPRGFLSVLSQEGSRLGFSKGSGRLELADAILRQPLAMRVIVNRIWKWHFGSGIVDTPSNFGFNGERPVHPGLLEYLADFFVRNGLSIKKLHREIMLSSVYQLSNESIKANYDKDSSNRLYWRANRRRMDVEQIRDSLLATSGALDNKMGGPSEALTSQSTRRTLYGKVSRYKLDDFLQLFDFPSPNISAEQRYATIVPLQRLFFMNSDFVQQQAELLVRKIESEPTAEARIQKAYRLVFGRVATPEEVRLGLDYLRNEPLKEYEERKKAEEEKEKKRAEKKEMPDNQGAASDAPSAKSDQPEAPAMDPNGMMAGVVQGAAKGDEKKPLLPVTHWGRYLKVLLSSTEFMFIN